MSRKSVSLLLLLTAASAEEGTCSHGECYEPPERCDLFLANSTIPGAGLGIFVGSHKEYGDQLGFGDIAIPLVDIRWHGGRKKYFSMFSDYQWAGRVMGMDKETDFDDIEAYVPGLDCAINCNLALINVKKAIPEFDLAGLTRYHSPGAGAISPYFNGTTFANYEIPEGGELFKHYGDTWFTTRTKVFGLIPLKIHYQNAQHACEQWLALEHVTDEQKDTLWMDFVSELDWDSRGVNALPKTSVKAKQAAIEGIRSLYQPQAQKSIQELERDGRCLDNIRHDLSTLPHAGRGAFATRPLSEGQLVTGSPILHIPWRNFTDMYEMQRNKTTGKWKRNLGKPVLTHQLVLNYCFGHVDSTILLCPYSAGVNYINHNQSQANIKIEWPQYDGIMAHDSSWFDISPDELFIHRVGLAIEYVATRDIAAGEELFLDYGDAWEEAWQRHVETWARKSSWKSYLPASEWNDRFANAPLRTKNEQRYDPYPAHIGIQCSYKLVRSDWFNALTRKDPAKIWKIDDKGEPCNINKRYFNLTMNEYVYDIEMGVFDDEGRYTDDLLTRRGVPRIAMTYVDAYCSTDFHLPSAFRQAPGLPNEMLPDAWRNDVQL